MSSRLANVRLDAKRVRKAPTSRERGSKPTPDAKTLIRRIFEQHPDPAVLPPRDYDVHDRIAARKSVRRKLRPAG